MAATMIEDDLTVLSRNALIKTMKREGNDLGREGFAELLPDELRDNHRKFRASQGIAGLTPEPEKGDVIELTIMPIHQLGRDAFLSTIKYRDLSRIEVDADVQRPESKRRIPEIARYVAGGDGYFGAVMLTVVGGSIGSVVLAQDRLIIDGTCRIVVNDGQHRIAGIKKAISDRLIEGDRLDDDLPVVIYAHLDRDEQRQLFADVNLHAMKPPKAIGLNYNDRNLLVRFTKDVVEKSAAFRGKVNYLKTKVGPRDTELFTFSAIVDAVGRMIDDLSPETYDQRLAEAVEWWNQVDEAIGETWEQRNTVANTKVGLTVLASLYGFNVDWSTLASIDWGEESEIAAAVSNAGGTNAAIKAVYDVLTKTVVSEG